jgi:DNA-binding transcriptional LysR family regulator
MNQFQAMRVFTRVVELGSFSLAARQLGMSAAAVTRSIRMLEAHLNMRLLNRNTRSLSLTEVGKDYLQGCRTIIDRLDELESNLSQTTREVRGTLRLAAPMTFVASGLAQLLAGYRAAHPLVDFDVTTFDTRIDMVEGGFDVGFSDERRITGSTLVSRRLTVVNEIIVASPAYLARHGTPIDPHSLGEHSLLAFTDGTARAWAFADASGVYRVSTGAGMNATSSLMVREAALNHMGIALLPTSLVVEDIRRGALVRLLDQFEVNGGPCHISLLYSGRTNLSRKVRSFIDYTVEQFLPHEKALALRAVGRH